MMKTNQIICGDCIEELKKLEENSVDAIITDPPYGLEFMGKDWDKFGVSPARAKRLLGEDNVGTGDKFFDYRDGAGKRGRYTEMDLKEKNSFQEFIRQFSVECLRVLKPGGFLLSFGGTRTYHRMTCGIEDAGFEIRDTIMWLYGSGFPKSLNIGKQIDKMNYKWKEDFTKFGNYVKDCRVKKGLSRNQVEEELGTNTALAWWEGRNYLGKFTIQLPDKKHYEELKKLLEMDNRFDKLIDWQEAEREVIGKKENTSPKNFPLPNNYENLRFQDYYTKPATPEAKQWEGWGTALKPACEPIVVARKPLSEKNVALNVLKHGTGGLNIDECRIKGQTPYRRPDEKAFVPETDHQWGSITKRTEYDNQQGRFPSNIILDEEAGKMLDEQSGEIISKKGKERFSTNTEMFGGGHTGEWNEYSDKGGASRFFYCAKASKSERNFGLENEPEKERAVVTDFRPTVKSNPENWQHIDKYPNMRTTPMKNNHPTVKPIKLMEYLIKLISREGAIVLDPFLGSGTTAIACLKLNRKFIGIEKEEEYVKIAQARIKPFLEQTKL